MSQNGFENENDSLKDVIEFGENMYNPGHYIGTGKVPPTVSAPGNAMPMAVFCFVAGLLILGFGLFLFLSDANVTMDGKVESAITNKIICLITMSAISLFGFVLGFAYLKKARKFRREKRDLESEPTDQNATDRILQRTCPKCGKSHDIDYPKCPYCHFNYLQ